MEGGALTMEARALPALSIRNAIVRPKWLLVASERLGGSRFRAAREAVASEVLLGREAGNRT